jgi:hypothetical protein
MRHRQILPILSILLITFVAVGALPSAQPAEASLPTPRHSVYPTEGPPGTMFFFSATGFSSERVGYWFNDPNGRIYANRYRYAVHAFDNTIEWRWQVPYDATPGYWTAVARGEESQQQQVIQFLVLPPAAEQSTQQPTYLPDNPPGATVTPSVGNPGTNFEFKVWGLDGERVGYWFENPNGQLIADDVRYWFKTQNNPQTWNWKAPYNAAPGVWKVTARGEESGIEYSLSFEINPSATQTSQQTAPVNPTCIGAVEPFIGYPNTDFSFYATGFPARTLVRYWAEDPNGRKYDYDDERYIGSNPDGRVDITWNAPADAAYGYWKMYFLSEETDEVESQIERVLYFEIRPPGEPIPPEDFVPPPPCPRGGP